MNTDLTFHLSLDFEGQHYEGTITPSDETAPNGMPIWFRVVLGDQFFAYLCCSDNGWRDRDESTRHRGLINAIGAYIMDYYE